MEDLLFEIENAIKKLYKKIGIGWLIWTVTFGFVIIRTVLSIFFAKETAHIKKERPPVKKETKSSIQTDKDDYIIPKIDDDEELEEKQTIKKEKEPYILPQLFQNKFFILLLLSVSIFLSIIENSYKMDSLVGGWTIVMYLLLLLPLVILVFQGKLKNPYIKWFLLLPLIMIADMFYYNNDFLQIVVPFVFYVFVILLYLSSMQTLHSLYQTLIPSFNANIALFSSLSAMFSNLISVKVDKTLYTRVGLALLITIPFLALFIALLFSADSNFSNFMTNAFDFKFDFNLDNLFIIPFYFLLFFIFYVFTFSNEKKRVDFVETKALDILIVGIFLSLINLLFVTFLSMQIPFLLSSDFIPQHQTLSAFAREGFFQLMMVMGIVFLILLFIVRRFKGERTIVLLLSGLLLETIGMGVVSLKKMYLYQEIKGATVLRYYVEWFDYLLLILLLVGIWFIVRKLNFSKLLNVIVIVSLTWFAIIISLNVDAMVAKNNVLKFKEQSELLDTRALGQLSIDASPILRQHGLDYDFKEKERIDCQNFTYYHFGYCSILNMQDKK